MKKVLFTATVDSHILQFHLPFLKLFKEKGYEVHVATNRNEEIPYCDVKHVVSFERSPFKLNNLKAIKQLKKIINEEKFDIIHTHTPMGSVVTRLAAKQARKKYHTRVIYTAHGLHFFKGAPLKNWIMFYPVEKYLSKFTDTLILINQEDYELCKKKFKKCKDIQYVPGVGIDEEKFNFKMTKKEKHELRESLGLKDDDFVMIYPAELSKRKRQVWLINSISELLKEHSDIHLLLPGKDSLKGKCQSLVSELNLENKIHFLGYRKDIPKLLKISNLAVSTASQEGLPVNLMEAMFMGLPIVATDCRGNRDLIKDNINGSLVDIVDNIAFSECIEKLYLSKEISLNFSAENNRIIKNYCLDKIMIDMNNIYFKKKSVAIITSGFLPVPATKGGAAENLIETLINENEKYYRIHPVVISSYDKQAVEISKNISNTSFIFVKMHFFSTFFDKFTYFIIDKVLKKENSRKFRFFLQRFDYLYSCSKILKNNNYDIVLLENHTIMYLALKLKNNYKKYENRYYYHCHNIVPSKYGMKNIISKTKKVISVSDFRNNYSIDFFEIGENKCKTVLNCCSQDIYADSSNDQIKKLKEKYSINNEKVILYVGRIDKDKGTLELVKACNKIFNDNYKLLIVGAPIFATGITTDYEKKVRDEVKINPKKIMMTGYVSHSDLYQYYDLADLVVIPSQIDDSAPLVLLESLVKGKAIVATNCGGIPEYLNEECSILIDRDNDYIDKLSNAIKYIISDDKIIKSMSKASHKQSKKYTSEEYYNNFVNELLEEE